MIIIYNICEQNQRKKATSIDVIYGVMHVILYDLSICQKIKYSATFTIRYFVRVSYTIRYDAVVQWEHGNYFEIPQRLSYSDPGSIPGGVTILGNHKDQNTNLNDY
ncbi:Hypothetical_protein [Hexamita inflata]|uniref:Hypothetical_protein n=1 Tax=Hexamita inflata TaxID=28002 RepID=A0AA86QL97_9EUKA|nr:Hypothetical protein HINF_LOCUS48365 [Hexamita inflata]